VTKPVLVVQQRAVMRRLLRLNLELEGVRVVEAATARECFRHLRSQAFAALVVDPEVFALPRHEATLIRTVRRLCLPTLVVANGPEQRRLALRLGGAPYIPRPDALERLVATVLALIAGVAVPTTV
jgi:DNA-binding response OmpR family regulator